MPSFDITPLVDGDLVKTGVNNRFTKIKSFLNSIPGTFLKAGSVNIDRLSNQRAMFEICVRVEDLTTATRVTGEILDGFKLPQLDAADYSGWKFSSYCIYIGVVAAHVAGTQLLVKKAAATIATVSLGGAAGTTTRAAVAEDTSATDDAWTVVYTKVGAASYRDVSLRLYFTAQLLASS